jgi:uncharacterized protein CbrC (UPF0167 family)
MVLAEKLNYKTDKSLVAMGVCVVKLVECEICHKEKALLYMGHEYFIQAIVRRLLSGM